LENELKGLNKQLKQKETAMILAEDIVWDKGDNATETEKAAA
jgi:hypothetical protein